MPPGVSLDLLRNAPIKELLRFSHIPKLSMEGKHSIDHLLLLITIERVKEWQSHQPVADIFCHRAVARLSAVLEPHIRKVERQIMKNAQDTVFLEVLDKAGTRVQVGQQHVKHVIRLLNVVWNHGQGRAYPGCPAAQRVLISLPDCTPAILDCNTLLELRQ